jgi:thioredoxin reductase (NADPH)
VALYVPLLLLGLAIALMSGSHYFTVRRDRRRTAQAEAKRTQLPVLVHSINDDRCTGCDACVVVCPTNVLDLVSNKSRVLRFGDCIQCQQCMFSCPTQALVMHWETEEPPPLRVPNLDPYYQTAVKGMYLIGEVAGKPLVKNAANVGRAVIEHMRREGMRASSGRPGARGAGEVSVDVAIVGSGPGGLSAALTCIHHGLSYVVLEKEQVVASTVARYPKGKDIMAEPYDVRNVSFLPVFDSRKEELLPLWDELRTLSGLDVRLGEAVESIRPQQGGFAVKTTVAAYRAQRVVLATGTRGKPRTLGVPGENLPKVSNLLDDPAGYAGRETLVVGGGDSAVEAACALADAGARVTLSYRGPSLTRCGAKNRERMQDYIKRGKVKAHLGSQVQRFGARDVVLQLATGNAITAANDAAFVLIGADAPVAWLEKLGVTYVDRPHWYALGATDQLVESLLGRLGDTPRDARSAAALVLGRPAATPRPETLPPPPDASVVRQLPLPDEASGLFTSAAPRRPIPLEEFARAPHQLRDPGRRRPRDAEATRMLRQLRDEGARLADEESRVSVLQTAAAPLPPEPGFSPIEMAAMRASAHAMRAAQAEQTEDVSNVELFSDVEVDSSVDLTADVEVLPDDAVISGEIGHEDPTRFGLELEPRHKVVRAAKPHVAPRPAPAPTPALVVGLPPARRGFLPAKTQLASPHQMAALRVASRVATPDDATAQVQIDHLDSLDWDDDADAFEDSRVSRRR